MGSENGVFERISPLFLELSKVGQMGTLSNYYYSQVKGGQAPLPPPSRLAVVLHGALLARCACGVLREVDPVRQGSRLDAPLLLKPEGLRPQKGCGGVYP